MAEDEFEKMLDELKKSQSNPYASAHQTAMEQARRDMDLQRLINDRAKDLAQAQQQQAWQNQYRAIAKNVFSTASPRGTSLGEDEFDKMFQNSRETKAEAAAKKKAKEAKAKQERNKSARILEKFLRNGFQTAKK